MATLQPVSLNLVRKSLKENENLFPHTKEKLVYFSTYISEGYKEYTKNKNEVAGHKKLEDFAKEIIEIHNQRFMGMTNEQKANYFKQKAYINKIVKDYTMSLISKNNPQHIFTNVNPNDDPRVDRFKEIINCYYGLVKVNGTCDLKKVYLQRLIKQFVSGTRLLSDGLYSDAFIIWRSLIESVSYYRVIKLGDEKTTNLFLNRRDIAAKIIGIVPASKEEMASISNQIENRKMGKSASWWEKQRFSWAAKFIIKSDSSAKSLMEAVNLGKHYPHYQVASLFTHEYLLSENDFKEIGYMDYLINLYWRTLEEVKEDFKNEFKPNETELASINKHEDELRKLLRPSRETFNSFNKMISD